MIPHASFSIAGLRPDQSPPTVYLFETAAEVPFRRVMAPLHGGPRVLMGAVFLAQHGEVSFSIARDGYWGTILRRDGWWTAETAEDPIPLAPAAPRGASENVILGVDINEGRYDVKSCAVNGQRVRPQVTVTTTTEIPDDVVEVNIYRDATPTGWAAQALHALSVEERNAQGEANDGVVTLVRKPDPITETLTLPAPLAMAEGTDGVWTFEVSGDVVLDRLWAWEA